MYVQHIRRFKVMVSRKLDKMLIKHRLSHKYANFPKLQNAFS